MRVRIDGGLVGVSAAVVLCVALSSPGVRAVPSADSAAASPAAAAGVCRAEPPSPELALAELARARAELARREAAGAPVSLGPGGLRHEAPPPAESELLELFQQH